MFLSSWHAMTRCIYLFHSARCPYRLHFWPLHTVVGTACYRWWYSFPYLPSLLFLLSQSILFDCPCLIPCLWSTCMHIRHTVSRLASCHPLLHIAPIQRAVYPRIVPFRLGYADQHGVRWDTEAAARFLYSYKGRFKVQNSQGRLVWVCQLR